MARRFSRSLISLLLVGAVPAAWFGAWALSPLRSGAPDAVHGGVPGGVIDIHRSDSHAAILKTLLSLGVIDEPERFNWLGRLTRQWHRIKAGEYKVSAAMSPEEIFSTLTSGISIVHPVTVREGENMYEIAEDMESKGLATQDGFLALCKDPSFIAKLGLGESVKSLEGFLFPDTYGFNKTMSTEDLLRMMVHHANQVWTPTDEASARSQGMSRYQVITLASIIEKETGAVSERPVISSVFHNRLLKKMRLQSDPTTIYGMWDRFSGKIHRADLLHPTPYNTYTVPELPIGPISNPGKASIEAALHPAQTDFIFFVSHGDGTHQFSRTLEEHNRAVRKFQLDPKAREGKSWRDLPKEQTRQSAPTADH